MRKIFAILNSTIKRGRFWRVRNTLTQYLRDLFRLLLPIFLHVVKYKIQRASIALHTQLYFRKQGAKVETAYVMSVKQNAVNVLITQFGMEGLIFFNELEKDVHLDEEKCLVEVNGKFFEIWNF